MSVKRTNDNRGSYRGAGAYSRDYAKFDGWNMSGDYPVRDIHDKIEGTGDYDGSFTGEVSRYDSGKQQWPRLADRMNTRGDGVYSKEGRRNTERARAQTDGAPGRSARVADNTDW